MTQSFSTEDHRRQKRAWRFIASAIVVVVVATIVVGIHYISPTVGPRYSSFAPVSITRTAPGSAGCASAQSTICYEAEVDSSFPGLAYSNLFFAVSNDTSLISYPVPSNVPLGAGASVSILNGTTVVGVWNYSLGTWAQVPGGYLPTTAPVVVVLDTELGTNTTLVGAYFYVEHSSPTGGCVGFPLS
jgi:hypothetical protein